MLGTSTARITHRGLKVKKNHLDGHKDELTKADPARGWDEGPAQSPEGAAQPTAGSLQPLAHTKPPLCPRGEQRRQQLLPGQRENKPQSSPEAGNSCF